MPVALNASDAAIVKGMLLRGDKQQDIAAWFGCNFGRIAEINKGKKHCDVIAAPAHVLPPPGPVSYFTPRPDMTQAELVRQVLAEFDLKWSRELAAAAHERRQTNEKIDRLTRQLLDLQHQLGTVENPKAPRPTCRRPMQS